MNRNKFLMLCLMMASSTGVVLAQETYDNTQLFNNTELNGTARYVGMGGALDALGADISTISTNPAGIGLFRRSQFTVSGGLVAQEEGGEFNNAPSTRGSFDQLGIVYVAGNGRGSFFNASFNFHKSRNLSQILTAARSCSYASQNKLSVLKYEYGNDLIDNEKDGEAMADIIWNAIDQANYDICYDDTDNMLYYSDASSYTFGRETKGYIGTYDFNLSGNVNDRFYWGLTASVHDVHYNAYSEHTDHFTGDNAAALGHESLMMSSDQRITGSGFDIKAGVIVRPVEDSPFRFGVAISTPTYYDLTTSCNVALYDGKTRNKLSKTYGGSYDFKVYTPWKFNLSLGHTIGNSVALGAVYEYSDYSTTDSRVIQSGYYDYWDGYVSSSHDGEMNNHTKSTLRGVSTLKLGAEIRVDDNWSVRAGYNYVSPMFHEDGYRDGTLVSYGSKYAASTDYTNWKTTNRMTCGVGYTNGKFSADLAYQYTATNGDFYPYLSYYDKNGDEKASNIADAVAVKQNRHRLLFTIGYRF